jgi:hypothetical protein
MIKFSSTQHSPQSLLKVQSRPDLPGFSTRGAALELAYGSAPHPCSQFKHSQIYRKIGTPSSSSKEDTTELSVVAQVQAQDLGNGKDGMPVRDFGDDILMKMLSKEY